MTLAAWIDSILHRQVLPYLFWEDPLPSLMRLRKKSQTIAAAYLHRARNSGADDQTPRRF